MSKLLMLSKSRSYDYGHLRLFFRINLCHILERRLIKIIMFFTFAFIRHRLCFPNSGASIPIYRWRN